MNNDIITSKSNESIKKLAALISSKKERDRSGLFVCEGARLCLDGFHSGRIPAGFYASEEALNKHPELMELMAVADKGAVIAPGLAAKISDTKSPQGVFAVFKKLDNEKTAVTINKGGSFLLLSQIQNPGNVGAVIRSCEAFGVSGLIMDSGCADIYSPKTLRASMGGVFRLPIRVCGDLLNEVARLKAAGINVYAAALVRDAVFLDKCAVPKNFAVLIGNEGNGLSRELIEAAGTSIAIPMAGKAESLNAAVAAGIIIWHFTNKNKGRGENTSYE